jgi:aminoglycoside phosphotransferase (APT) family kinase protein
MVGAQAVAPKRPTSEELRAALEQALCGQFGRRRMITVTRRLSPYRSSFNLENLNVQLDDGTSVPLVFKDLSRGAMLKDARRARPDFVHQPQREIQTYRMILARHGLGTARCYGAVMDVPLGRYWLFLERVPGLELRHIGDLATWQQAARWLADLHTRFAGATTSLSEVPELQLVRYDADYYRLWLHRAQMFAQRTAKKGKGRPSLKQIEWLARRYDAVVERLVSLPATLIHGEFFACNVWVHKKVRCEPRVCPVDWEMTAIGPGLIDLGALCSGWNDRQRSVLALTYYSALRRTNGWPPKQDEFFAALDCCQLHLAVKMLGWSCGWSAPAHQARNWLSEAVRLAKRLGL